MNTQSRTQALLQAFSGTKEDLEAFIDSIPNDKAYQEYKAAHPEPNEKWQNMTREQQNEYIIDLIMQLAERAKAQQARTEENRVCQISDEQAIPAGETWDTITDYCHREQANPKYKDKASNDMMLLLDMFEYGKICGIRQERARRKGAEQ